VYPVGALQAAAQSVRNREHRWNLKRGILS